MNEQDIKEIKKLVHKILDDLESDKPDFNKINFNLRLASDTVKNLTDYENACEFSAMLRRMKKAR